MRGILLFLTFLTLLGVSIGDDIGIVAPSHTFYRRKYNSVAMRTIRDCRRDTNNEELGVRLSYYDSHSGETADAAVSSLLSKYNDISTVVAILPLSVHSTTYQRATASFNASTIGNLNVPLLLWNDQGFMPTEVS